MVKNLTVIPNEKDLRIVVEEAIMPRPVDVYEISLNTSSTSDAVQFLEDRNASDVVDGVNIHFLARRIEVFLSMDKEKSEKNSDSIQLQHIAVCRFGAKRLKTNSNPK